MKLVWSPEIASKAYIDTVKSCEIFQESSIAELVSAMAGGWNARLIVEAWFRGGATATSVGLAVASQHARGRHVCVVPDEVSRSEYLAAMHKAGMSPEVMVGEAEEVMRGLVGVDFLVVDCRRKDRAQVLRFAKLGHRGAVLICKNAAPRGALGFRWRSVLDKGSRIVRTAFLPVGKGLEIAYIGASRDESLSSVKGSTSSRSRWVRHIDQESGEENVFRR